MEWKNQPNDLYATLGRIIFASDSQNEDWTWTHTTILARMKVILARSAHVLQINTIANGHAR